MRQHLFIILTLATLSACSVVADVGTNGANIGLNDHSENTSNVNAGAGNNNFVENDETPPTDDKNPIDDASPIDYDARPTDINFTSFDDVPADTGTVTIDGIGKQQTYILGNYGDVWDSGDKPTISLIYDNGRISAMKLWHDTHITGFNKQYVTIDYYNIFGGLAIDDIRAYLTIRNPETNGWKYQTIISWQYWQGSEYANSDDSESSSDNHKEITHSWIGVASIGNETLGANIPKTGTVSFSGHGVGYQADSDDSNKFRSFGFTITATANFTDREVALESRYNSTDTEYFTGTLTYNNSSNNLSGFITRDYDDAINFGIAKARFYGAGAEEFGGTFEFLGYYNFGAFGAKRDE